MNTNELLANLQLIVDTKCYYLNVIGSNQLENIFKKIKLPLAIIVNTDPDHLSGTHWVAIIRNGFGSVELFDSYGESLKSLKHFRFLYSHTLKENCQALQSMVSNVCGQYCLYFLYKRVNGVSYESLLSTFGINKRRNDGIVRRFQQTLNMKPSSGSKSSRQHCKLQCCKSRVLSTQVR